MTDENKNLIRILDPEDREKKPVGLVTWQYIWDKNICVLISSISPDGTEKPGRCMIIIDEEEKPAKEGLDEMVAELEKNLSDIYKKKTDKGEDEPAVAVSNRNKKGPMGFLK